jgi:hypothetical protein
MFGLRRFRFRSPERNRETDERRLARIKGVPHSAVLEAEAELRGLRARVARTRRSVTSLLAQVEDREPDPACRAELTNLERTLLAGEPKPRAAGRSSYGSSEIGAAPRPPH